VQISRQGNRRTIEFFGPRRRRRSYESGHAWVARHLCQVVSELRKASFLSVAEDKENTPCRQGEEVDNHLIQRRKGKCPEREVGKCRIQMWKEECEIFMPEWRTWR
jgi:hypothetical protein